MKAFLFLLLILAFSNLFGQDTTPNKISLLPEKTFKAGQKVNLHFETVNDSCNGILTLPKYSLGNDHLGKFLVDNTKQPGNLGETEVGSVDGQLIVSFIVNSIGKIENAQIVSSPHKKTSEHIIEAVNKLKDFTPAKCNNIPISIKLYYVAILVDIFKEQQTK